MATDFSYGNKTINSSGPMKPSGKNQPLDPRTEVKLYADIETIPNPYVGMIITVLQDETNSNKMTDYKVLSLKADNLGVANSVVDQVQRYVDYLGANGQSVDTNNFATKEELGLKADKTELHSHINKTVLDGITSTNVDNWNNKIDKVEGKILTTNDYTNEEKQTVASLKTTVGDISSGLVKDVEDLKTNGVSQDNINAAIENYLTEHPVQSGATAEQAAQIAANTNAIGDENSGLVKEVNDIKNTELQNLNAAIQTLETLVGVDETVGDKSGLPSGDANVIASINRIDNKPSGTVTDEQISTAVNNYLTEHPVQSGATAEQVAQIEANKTAIGDENSGLIKEINDIKNASGTFKNIYANNDMPTVFITSDTLTNLKSKADGKANCEFEIRFKNQIIRCFGTGAVQGNSSTRYPAKNYTFKFYSNKENTTNFNIDVGWGLQNKYCFKKNWIDSTHTRNLSGARIAYDMVNSRPESDFKTNLLNTPHNGSVDGFPTKVYVNGEFWGLYTWNIPKDAWMFNMDDKNPNHMVLCAEHNNNGDNTQNNTCEFRATWGGQSDGNWSIEVGTYSEALKNSFNNAISHVMNSSDEDFKTNFSNYFDLYSILDYYCFSYLTAHIDGLGQNILMATYDSVHWGACLYDMDSIYGANWNGQGFKNANIRCPEDYQETNSLLWQRVVKSFPQELHDRYFELRNGALSLGNIITHVEEIYDLIPDRVFNDDYQKWTGIPERTTNTITRFRNYMRDRAVYCDERFKELILDKSVTGVTISGKTEVKIGSSITLTANLTPSIADVKTGSWSASNTNVTLNDSNSLSVVVNGSVLGSSTITFTSDDTTNGTISATYDVNVVEASSGGSGGETQPYEAELILQPVMAGVTWQLHSASTSSDCTGFECKPNFAYFDFPEDTSSTDTSYMYCESLPVVTESEKTTNNIPCVTGTRSGNKEYITLKLSNSDASTIDGLKTYLTNNIISLKVNMKPEVSKYTFNTDNITMSNTSFSKPGYVLGEFIDNNCPVTTNGNNVASALFMAGLPSNQDWSNAPEYSYFKIGDWNGSRYIGFQIAENLLTTPDLNGIKEFFSKNPTLFYVV